MLPTTVIFNRCLRRTIPITEMALHYSSTALGDAALTMHFATVLIDNATIRKIILEESM